MRGSQANGNGVREAQGKHERRQVIERRLEASPREDERSAGEPRIETPSRHEGQKVLGAGDAVGVFEEDRFVRHRFLRHPGLDPGSAFLRRLEAGRPRVKPGVTASV